MVQTCPNSMSRPRAYLFGVRNLKVQTDTPLIGCFQTWDKITAVLSCLFPGSHKNGKLAWAFRTQHGFVVKIEAKSGVELYLLILHFRTSPPAVHLRLTAQISKHQVDFAEKREAERVAKAHRAATALHRYSLGISWSSGMLPDWFCKLKNIQ